jgi:hypothetical protein
MSRLKTRSWWYFSFVIVKLTSLHRAANDPGSCASGSVHVNILRLGAIFKYKCRSPPPLAFIVMYKYRRAPRYWIEHPSHDSFVSSTTTSTMSRPRFFMADAMWETK